MIPKNLWLDLISDEDDFFSIEIYANAREENHSDIVLEHNGTPLLRICRAPSGNISVHEEGKS